MYSVTQTNFFDSKSSGTEKEIVFVENFSSRENAVKVILQSLREIVLYNNYSNESKTYTEMNNIFHAQPNWVENGVLTYSYPLYGGKMTIEWAIVNQ